MFVDVLPLFNKFISPFDDDDPVVVVVVVVVVDGTVCLAAGIVAVSIDISTIKKIRFSTQQ